MDHRQLHQRGSDPVTIALPFLVLVVFLLPSATLKAQTDTSLTAASSGNSAFVEPLAPGSLAFFVGFHQGLHTERGQTTGDADWLLGVSRTIALGSTWELAPEVSLWHMIPIRSVPSPAQPPSGGRARGEKWNLNMKLALPIRWFALRTGRHAGAYVLLGPSYLFSSQAGGFTLDTGGGLSGAVSRSVALTIEARTYLYFQTNESVVLASPISIMMGVRWTLAK